MGHAGVLRVFPVWPKNKDASFHRLRIFGAFLVSSELKDAEVQHIEIISEKGKVLNLLNPWDSKEVEVIRPSGKREMFKGKRLKIKTSTGEKILINQK